MTRTYGSLRDDSVLSPLARASGAGETSRRASWPDAQLHRPWLERPLQQSADLRRAPSPRGACSISIEIDAASNSSVDEQWRVSATRWASAPARIATKIYIIDEVRMLGRRVQRPAQELLEAAPFAPSSWPPYTRSGDHCSSRCQRFDFRRIPTPEIAQHFAARGDGRASTPAGRAASRHPSAHWGAACAMPSACSTRCSASAPTR